MRSIVPAPGRNINSRNFIVETGDDGRGPLLLKIVPEGEGPRHDGRPGFIRRCFEAGVNVPEPIPALDGRLVVHMDGMAASAFRYHPSVPYDGRPGQLEAAALALGSLNAHLGRQDPRYPRNPRYAPLSAGEWSEFRDRYCRTNSFLVTPSYWVDVAWRLEAECLARPEFQGDGVTQHCDFHPANALFLADGRCLVVDFDSIRQIPLFSSAMFAAERFGGSLAGAMRFLDQYRRQDRRLAREDFRLYPVMVAHEALCRIRFIIRDVLQQGSSPWLFEIPNQLRRIMFMRAITEREVREAAGAP